MTCTTQCSGSPSSGKICGQKAAGCTHDVEYPAHLPLFLMKLKASNKDQLVPFSDGKQHDSLRGNDVASQAAAPKYSCQI